jgi:hypothetical protein
MPLPTPVLVSWSASCIRSAASITWWRWWPSACGAVLGPPALWVLPVAFPMVMAFGGLLGLLGVPIPGVDIGLAISGLVMALMVLFELQPPLWLAALIVSAFAVFHGHAHGAELPARSKALPCSLAFVVAIGLLHLVGLLLGETRRWPGGRRFRSGGRWRRGAGGAVVPGAGPHVTLPLAHLAPTGLGPRGAGMAQLVLEPTDLLLVIGLVLLGVQARQPCWDRLPLLQPLAWSLGA